MRGVAADEGIVCDCRPYICPHIYYVAGYRRKVVEDNMARCFPDRSAEERRRLEKDFYRNFADYIMETVKLFHISDSEMERRMKFRNIEIIDSLVRQGRSVAVYFSHCGNWEWAPSVTLHARTPSGRRGRVLPGIPAS